jgi:hypothetical protein
VLHASGIPVTVMGRWDWKYDTGVSSAERRFWDFVLARRLLRHRQRPNIEPWPGRVQVALQAAAVLRANEVVTISSDAAPLQAERARAIETPFLGKQVRLMPGVVALAQLTGAPVLMAFVRRSADYRHQVLEISPPVPMDGKTEAALGRCAAAMDAAIRTSPAHWHYWFETDVLARLGVLPETPPIGTAPVSPQPAAGLGAGPNFGQKGCGDVARPSGARPVQADPEPAWSAGSCPDGARGSAPQKVSGSSSLND